MKLPLNQFKNVVRDSVLVALDLLIMNEKRQVLVGERRNSPAKGWFFVPGGRVLKGESLDEALQRISMAETGIDFSQRNGSVTGIYDHIYPDNSFGEPGVSTHYVVIACVFFADSFAPVRCDNQHHSFELMNVGQLLEHPRVHPYTRNYFVPNPPNIFLSVSGSRSPLADWPSTIESSGVGISKIAKRRSGRKS